MARPLRIEYEGALYHVTSRGNAREVIFVDDKDRHVYRRFVRERVHSSSPWAKVTGQVLLGSPASIRRLARRLKASESVKEIPRRQRLAARPSLAILFPKTGFRNHAARNRMIHRAHLDDGYTLTENAQQFGLHYTTISKIVNTRE